MESASSRGTDPFRRYATVILIVFAIAAPAMVYGAIQALRSTSNDPRQWLPKSFAATDTYDWFQSQFGTDEIAVVSWTGCEMDDPRVARLSAELESSPYFDRVRSGPSVVAELTGPPLRLSRQSAINRLRGTLVGDDNVSTCLVLTTSVNGQADRSSAVAAIENLAKQSCDLDPAELKLAGPTVDAAMIDAESRKLLFQLAGLSGLVSFVVASFRLRSVRLALSVLTVAVYSTAASLALMHFCGGTMNLLSTMLPPLIYVLTVSSAVHLANYYRDESQAQSSSLPASVRAVKQGLVPCGLAAITTGIGLISLVLSKIEPIQSFGLFSAIGVIISVAVQFLLLPSAIHLFPPRSRAATRHNHSDGNTAGRFGGLVCRHHGLFAISCLIVMALCGVRIPWIESTVKLQDRFLPDSDVINDYRWLEEKIGPMVPMEVAIHFDSSDPRDRVEQLTLVASIQNRIQSSEHPVATMSAVNFCPPLPRSHSVRGIVSRKIISGDQLGHQLSQARFLSQSEDETLWRISIRANAIGDLDYGVFIEQIRAATEPLLKEHQVVGTFTGVIPLIYKAQRELLMDLFRSFIVAFGVIAIVLALVLRSVSATVLTMFPNIFPAVVVFGGIQWIGIPVQIGSVMTASAALGIAVDDTVHLLTWFRRSLAEGHRRQDSIQHSLAKCAGAMIHTTLICSCGLAIFAISDFVPILHFAWLMVLLLAAALIGDLILLPAILAGPLGRVFERRDG